MYEITFYFTDDFGATEETFWKAETFIDDNPNFIGCGYYEGGKKKVKMFNVGKVLEIHISDI